MPARNPFEDYRLTTDVIALAVRRYGRFPRWHLNLDDRMVGCEIAVDTLTACRSLDKFSRGVQKRNIVGITAGSLHNAMFIRSVCKAAAVT